MKRKLSELMEQVLSTPETARAVHEVAMSDGRRTVTLPGGRRVVLFTARGGRGLKFTPEARQRRIQQGGEP